MTKECVVTGKKPMVGNNVSHAQNKTKRRFMPNLQTVRLYSEKLSKFFKLKVTTAGIRTIEHNGGLDGFVMSKAPTKLSPELRKVRKELEAKTTNKAA
jgi:large subunit ribosomal protein L28